MHEGSAPVTCEWLKGDEIVVYRLNAASLQAVTQWAELALRTMQEWPKDRPYLAVHDLSKPGVGLLYMAAVQYDVFQPGVTPGGSDMAGQMLENNPGWRLSVAILVSYSLTGRMTKLKAFQVGHENSTPDFEVFFNMPSALIWLEKRGTVK